MNDSQLLSAFQELGPQPARQKRDPRALVFDACQLGVVIRAVLFVEAVMAVGAMFGATGFFGWLERLAMLSGAALPGTLGWLLIACCLKRLLARLPPTAQHAFGVALGAVSGLYGCGLLALVARPLQVPWTASAFTGGLLSAALVAALAMRAKGRTPAETTARLAELQARIRPHFLFNSLNSAIALVREDPRRAESLLEDLSELFRHVLVDQGESVTLAEEVQVARRYLAVEEVRFGERLRVEWSIDALAGNARVPALFLQPLVENAVKHGVEPSPTGADVKVTTQRRGGVVVIKVTNTVPSGQGRPGHGLAQDNVRNRLRLLHDVEAQFQTALIDGRYQVRMEVPA
ncbi:MAG: putative histidine kinase, classic [Ramlibacter sp.]|jgi:two-component system sensor histidine kinase AlgZ|uniref:sensor histidine kinase n=1 Tax=Ramlibacter sp. TaxID=1917967 RepID=UPI00262E2064|nr:histidine kinase [Ramlibacter sp.]MDB5752239.1 putative histidine kinase, classic [Ramlibacter sp.]